MMYSRCTLNQNLLTNYMKDDIYNIYAFISNCQIWLTNIFRLISFFSELVHSLLFKITYNSNLQCSFILKCFYQIKALLFVFISYQNQKKSQFNFDILNVFQYHGFSGGLNKCDFSLYIVLKFLFIFKCDKTVKYCEFYF